MARYNIDGNQILSLQGSPYEMGLEHGRLLREEIGIAVDDYLRHSDKLFDVPFSVLSGESQRCIPFIPAEYLEEIQGMADGSGVSFDDIVTLNCMIDIDNVYTHSMAHCCNFVLGSPVAGGDELIHCRNLDFPHHGILQKTSIIVLRTPSHGNALPTLGVSWAGFAGMLTGCNAQQLAASEVTSPATGNSVEGTPISMLIRKALESGDSLDRFYEVVKNAVRTSGYNIAVSDGKTGKACAVEFTRDTCKRRWMHQGRLVVDSVRLCDHPGASYLSCPAGAFRHARLMQLIEGRRGAADEAFAKEILSDRYDLARARKRGTGYFCICNDNTVQSVVFFPREERVLISHTTTPSPHGHYGEILLREHWATVEDLEATGVR